TVDRETKHRFSLLIVGHRGGFLGEMTDGRLAVLPDLALVIRLPIGAMEHQPVAELATVPQMIAKQIHQANGVAQFSAIDGDIIILLINLISRGSRENRRFIETGNPTGQFFDLIESPA